MSRTTIAQLKDGAVVSSTFLVGSKQRRVGRTGSAYLDLELQDATGVIPAKLWDSDRLRPEFDQGDVVAVQGQVENFQGLLQFRVSTIRRCSDGALNPTDYLPCSRRDPEEMFAALLGRVRALRKGPLRALLLAVLEDPAVAAAYKRAPAATAYHHAYLGGLLEHVLSLTELAGPVCDHYGWLDKELVLAGLVLHDLGKVEELSCVRGLNYSTRGRLVGHIAIGLEMVREKMRGIPGFPESLKMRLEHILLSHHGKAEFGSPKEPMFPEALVVHYLDDLDSKLASMRAQYEMEDGSSSEWTTRNRALGRELLKPLSESH